MIASIADLMILGWYPFLDPLPIDRFWLLLLVPLVIVVAVVYKTIKLPDLSRLPRQSASLAAQILAFMVLAAVVLWILTELT
ncbi:MAG: hypothetical protein MI741_23360 [Rhodospirillales bacterium]|nr:hypothetical protein [Rhodospirillales bacterium]